MNSDSLSPKSITENDISDLDLLKDLSVAPLRAIIKTQEDSSHEDN